MALAQDLLSNTTNIILLGVLGVPPVLIALIRYRHITIRIGKFLLCLRR